MMWIYILWGIFTTIFLTLGYYHCKMAGKSISHFQVGSNQMKQSGVKAQIHLVGIDFVEFVNKFNRYIDYYNQTAKKQHKIQAIGYWVATAVALFSLAITLIG